MVVSFRWRNETQRVVRIVRVRRKKCESGNGRERCALGQSSSPVSFRRLKGDGRQTDREFDKTSNIISNSPSTPDIGREISIFNNDRISLLSRICDSKD